MAVCKPCMNKGGRPYKPFGSGPLRRQGRRYPHSLTEKLCLMHVLPVLRKRFVGNVLPANVVLYRFLILQTRHWNCCIDRPRNAYQNTSLHSLTFQQRPSMENVTSGSVSPERQIVYLEYLFQCICAQNRRQNTFPVSVSCIVILPL